MRKTIAGIATVLMLGVSSTTFAASFTDVPANHWAHDRIIELSNAGIISSSEKFNGDRAATKYETATMFCKLLADVKGIRAADQNEPFNDVPKSHWAHEYVATLANAGVIPTNSSTFDGANQITRYELAEMFYNAFANKSAETQKLFSDVSESSPYFKAVQWAGDSGVMDGEGDGAFHGDRTLTRYELARLIGNFYAAF